MLSGELINLKRVDINTEKHVATIRVPNKGKHERVVFFPKLVSDLLIKYYSIEEEKENAFNLTYSKLNTMLGKVGSFLKTKKITAHSWRHSFANMLAENEISVRVAQKLMGHKNMGSTLIYYDPDIRIMEKLYRKRIENEEAPT